jgi:hypothetical protein
MNKSVWELNRRQLEDIYRIIGEALKINDSEEFDLEYHSTGEIRLKGVCIDLSTKED